LRIKDIEFEVDHQKSEFVAYIPQESPGIESPGRLHWSIEVNCLEKETERELWTPYLYVNDMKLDVTDWRMIEGLIIRNEGKDGLGACL
jgi:hypothetical protein